jgi:hypothetical protein
MGAAALALGIVGVVLCWIPFFGWVGVLVALAALVLAIAAIAKKEKRLGLAGLVLGIIGLAWGGFEQLMAIESFDRAVDVVSGDGSGAGGAEDRRGSTAAKGL